MTVTRRDVFAAGAALAVAPALMTAATTPAAAATEPTGKQVPGVYRHKLGAFEVTAINDGGASRPLEGFVRNVPLAEVQAAMQSVFLPTDKFNNVFNPILLNTGSKLVLFDTGNGAFGAPTTGRLVDGLKAAGVDPKAIDLVIISHFHGDHINGLRGKDGVLTYPNAEIMVPAAEWDFWMDDAKMAAAPEAMKGAFANVRRALGPSAKDLKRFAAGDELVTGVQAVAAYGHTPGHTAFAIQSDGQRLMYVADSANHPVLFIERPNWSPVFDMNVDEARATKRKLLDMAAAERMAVAGYHFPFPGFGNVAKDGDAYRYVPASWNPVL